MYPSGEAARLPLSAGSSYRRRRQGKHQAKYGGDSATENSTYQCRVARDSQDPKPLAEQIPIKAGDHRGSKRSKQFAVWVRFHRRRRLHLSKLSNSELY